MLRSIRSKYDIFNILHFEGKFITIFMKRVNGIRYSDKNEI